MEHWHRLWLTKTQKTCIQRRVPMCSGVYEWMCRSASQLFSTVRISRAKYLLNSLGPHHRIHKHAHNCYTTANKQFYLPSPDTASFIVALKGERLFLLFPGKWILYQLCVCKSDLYFQESRGYYSYLLDCICKSSTI